jgi:hypothetical protein
MFLRHDMSIQIMYMKPPKLTSLVPWVSKHKSECPFASEQLTVSASSCFKVQASKHFFVQVEATQHRRVGSHCHAALFQCRWVEHTVQYPLLERRGTISATPCGRTFGPWSCLPWSRKVSALGNRCSTN